MYSARISGPTATDAKNNAWLLERLANTPTERRGAHYVCHAALADPTGMVRAESEAICRGRIRREFSGSAGFGYDPLFEVLEYHRTFGELGDAVKAAISHRARAIRQLVPRLAELLAGGDWS